MNSTFALGPRCLLVLLGIMAALGAVSAVIRLSQLDVTPPVYEQRLEQEAAKLDVAIAAVRELATLKSNVDWCVRQNDTAGAAQWRAVFCYRLEQLRPDL